ncbi:fanconi-associated nuclease 1 [Biomphalaria glabrata]|nr:fanconi-associated nuclease 1 [Biomphalaria glabrata]
MSPKRKTKLPPPPSIVMHSITSLFEKQNEKLQNRLKSTSSIELDEDLQITKVEIASPYFKKDTTYSSGFTPLTALNTYGKGTTKKRKLSLNKPLSSTDFNHSQISLNGDSKNTNTFKKLNDINLIKEDCISSDIVCKNVNNGVPDVSPTTMSLVETGKPLLLDGVSTFLNESSSNIDLQTKTQPTNQQFISNTVDPFSGRVSNLVYEDKQEQHIYSRPQSDKEDMGTEEGLTDIVTDNSDAFKVPYYLNNFEAILHSVISDASNGSLFNSEDLSVITSYKALTESAKKLYIRMFCRKMHWIPLSRLNYPEIAEDLTPYLLELQRNLFIYCEDDLNDLEQVLKSLSAADIKTLAKSYHIADQTAQQKMHLVDELMKVSRRNSIGSLFGSKFGNISRAMLIKAKTFLKGIFKLRLEPRRVFVRVIMLYSVVNTSVDEDTGVSGQTQLFQMLMVNMGKLVYPTYTVNKVHNIFSCREDVIRFEHALQLESDLLHCVQRGQWDKAYDVFKCVEEQWELLKSDEHIEKWNRNLPDYLRGFTATSVLNRLMTVAIDILQRRKDFTTAVELLKRLLSQAIYNCSHRGYWWERLALNLDVHLKDPKKSLDVIAEGLADKHVIGGHRLALYLRAESICQKNRSKLKDRFTEFYHDSVKELPKVFLEGRVLHDGVSNNGTKFLTDESYADGNSQDMTVCGVEEFVLAYYKKNGFPSGIHAEGSIVSTLFEIFFWDIIFMPLPDAFHSPYQVLPLDFYSEAFYERRKDVIEDRLQKLSNNSVQELESIVEDIYDQHEGSQCIGINWERMRSADVVKEIVSCLGGQLLSGVIARYAQCPRHTRSGFPDLTLWNSQTKKLKICEVKGPGDRLSHKQILWIDYLLKLGIDAEVCHVKAVAAKRLRY